MISLTLTRPDETLVLTLAAVLCLLGIAYLVRIVSLSSRQQTATGGIVLGPILVLLEAIDREQIASMLSVVDTVVERGQPIYLCPVQEVPRSQALSTQDDRLKEETETLLASMELSKERLKQVAVRSASCRSKYEAVRRIALETASQAIVGPVSLLFDEERSLAGPWSLIGVDLKK